MMVYPLTSCKKVHGICGLLFKIYLHTFTLYTYQTVDDKKKSSIDEDLI